MNDLTFQPCYQNFQVLQNLVESDRWRAAIRYNGGVSPGASTTRRWQSASRPRLTGIDLMSPSGKIYLIHQIISFNQVSLNDVKLVSSIYIYSIQVSKKQKNFQVEILYIRI